MKSLYSILEANFSKGDFEKHNYKNDVINQMVNTASIRTGKNGEGTFTIDPKTQQELKDEIEKRGDDIGYDDYNTIASKYNLPKWTQIFKGDFSGYVNGLASKNRGNAFEVNFVDDFNSYAKDLADCINSKKRQVSVNDLLNGSIELVGGKNNPRPLSIKSGELIVGDIKTSGDALADVCIRINDNQYYNISLKYGSSVTFVNIGIGRIFTKQSFDEFIKTNEYDPGKEGEAILDFFGIDRNRFASIFTNYKGDGKKKKSNKEEVDVTNYAKTSQFYDFMRSVIGYNYILVHKLNNRKIHYYNLLTEKDLDDFIGNIQSMKILYPQEGSAKRVDILLETSNLIIKFNIRSKSGSVYPTHIMADYTIKH